MLAIARDEQRRSRPTTPMGSAGCGGKARSSALRLLADGSIDCVAAPGISGLGARNVPCRTFTTAC